MCDSQWFSKLKSHTYTWRVVHTALLETEQLPISLEFVFLLFASCNNDKKQFSNLCVFTKQVTY